MKQAKYIISQITVQPSLKKLERIASYKKLLALLPLRYQNAVKFMYNKNDTLFFVLEHPSFKMEFNYKKTLIKGLLKELIKQDKSCSCIDADELKFFVTNKVSPQVLQETNKECVYNERSLGKFKNRAKDEKLSMLFEEIRGLICKRDL
jgi:hypothetical protein